MEKMGHESTFLRVNNAACLVIGVLEPHKRERVLEHLLLCDSCRREWAAVKFPGVNA